MTRVHLIATGVVQGVGFRFTMERGRALSHSHGCSALCRASDSGGGGGRQ